MNELKDIVVKEIRDHDQITFSRFMELALYHRDYGYYTSGNVRIGREGDYYTSPYVNKAFGQVISKFILIGLDAINNTKPAIVEIGAGKGILAKDILDNIRGSCESTYNKLTYYFIEISHSLIMEAKKELNDHLGKIIFTSDINELDNDSIEGIVFSNELFDAIPFHRTIIDSNSLKEIYITLENENLKEYNGPLSNKDIETYLNDYQLSLKQGQELEICTHATKMLKDISNVIKRGFLLTIDYGYLAEELYNYSRMKGTYKCIHQHTMNEDPYSNIGEQDITAHVNFSKLINEGEKIGLNKVIYTTQGQFLLDWGILDIIENHVQNPGKYSEKEISSLKTLFLPGSMGNSFKVLLQEKNLKSEIINFYPDSPFKISFDIV